MAEEHPQSFRKCKDELSMRKTEEYFFFQVFGKQERPFLTAGGTQIKPFAGEGAEIVVTAFRVTAADTGYTLPVVAAGEKVIAHRLNSIEAKLSVFPGIFIIITAAEIGKMTLEDLVESVSSPGKVLGILFFQYRSILYTHIEYYRENVNGASLTP